jgi:cytochrome b561
VNPNEQRYTAVAIVLHWAIAAAHYVVRPDLVAPRDQVTYS